MLWFLCLIFYSFSLFPLSVSLSLSAYLSFIFRSAWPYLNDTVNRISAWQQWPVFTPSFVLSFFFLLHHHPHLVSPTVNQSVFFFALPHIDFLSLIGILWYLLSPPLSFLLKWRGYWFQMNSHKVNQYDMPVKKRFKSKPHRCCKLFNLYSWVQLRVFLQSNWIHLTKPVQKITCAA